MVPRFCWLLLELHESLYSMKGFPVSTCASIIANQSCCALITRRGLQGDGMLGAEQQHEGDILVNKEGQPVWCKATVHTPHPSERLAKRNPCQRSL